MFTKDLEKHQNFSKKKFAGDNFCERILILSDGDDDRFRSETQHFVERLKKSGKKVECIYFYSKPSDSDDGYSQKEVKWYGIPQNEFIDNILGKEFDLFLFLYPRMENHLKYLSILNNAKFKVGPSFTEEDSTFDLTIDIQDKSDIRSLIRQIETHLKLLGN